jgi:hypothetical protein
MDTAKKEKSEKVYSWVTTTLVILMIAISIAFSYIKK